MCYLMTLNVLATLKGGNVESCWYYSKNVLLVNKLNMQAEHFSNVQFKLLICVKYFISNGVLAKTVDL